MSQPAGESLAVRVHGVSKKHMLRLLKLDSKMATLA